MAETGDDAVAEGSLQRMFTYRVVALLNVMRRSGTLAYRRLFDLSPTEWRVMVQAGEHAPLTLAALAEGIDRDAGQTSRVVKALVARGLLDSRRGPGGPAVTIEPTAAGRALHGRLTALAAERDRWLVGGTTAEELERTAQVLDRLAHRAGELLERERKLSGG